MKKIVLGLVFLCTMQLCFSQQGTVENERNKYLIDTAAIARLHSALRNSKHDTLRVLLMQRLIAQYSNNLDSTLHYCFVALNLSRTINYHKGELVALSQMQNALKHYGVLLKAFNICHNALQASRRYGDKYFEANFLGELGILYRESKVFPNAMAYLNKSKDLYDSLGQKYLSFYQLNNIGEVYLLKHELDSALWFCRLALKGLEDAPVDSFWMELYTSQSLGNIFMAQGKYDSALFYLRRAKKLATYHSQQFNANLSIAKAFDKLGIRDSAFNYAAEARSVALASRAYLFNSEINDFFSKFYLDVDLNKSTEFGRLALAYKDSVNRQNTVIALENFEELDEQEKQFEIQSAQAAYQFRVRLIGVLAGVLVLLIILGILIRNYRQKQKSIILLNQQKDELNRAKEKTEIALSDLKGTQTQLVHSEKMASLGALVAGIAHEIKNPLNFVNNFAEVNKELISEMDDAIQKGNLDEIKGIAKNISDNQEKIDHHGKRADAIVKSMLQHSRSGTGQRELTDINALCDEYLRLTYHGYRAKDKSFTAKVETHFDPGIEKVMIVGQDMGRVVLNVINNAFYAVSEKKTQKADFIPEVIVSTKKLEGKIEITIKDNGTGIPENIIDKIFQPFFTTKPAGQGTGLGLSLSYDIVKAHGGTIDVSSTFGEGSEFTIQLPS